MNTTQSIAAAIGVHQHTVLRSLKRGVAAGRVPPPQRGQWREWNWDRDAALAYLRAVSCGTDAPGKPGRKAVRGDQLRETT